MPSVTLEIPESMRLIVILGLSCAEVQLRQMLEKANAEPVTLKTADDMARWTGQIVWLEQAAEKLR